jgi:hypothetical protein
MAFTHGKDSTFHITDAGGTLRDITSYLSSAGLQRMADLAETSTLGSTYKSFVGGLIDASIPLDGLFDPTVDGYLAGILQLSKAFEYYPAGEPVGATKPKYSGNAVLTNYEINTGVDGPASISGEFQVDGAITRAVA